MRMIRGPAGALPDAGGPEGQVAGPAFRLRPAEVISRGLEFAGGLAVPALVSALSW